MVHINVFLHNKLLRHRASVIRWSYIPPTHWSTGFVCAAETEGYCGRGAGTWAKAKRKVVDDNTVEFPPNSLSLI